MFSFRQKIFLTYLIGFFLFLVLIFPLSGKLVRYIVQNAMESRSKEIIARIQHAPNNESLIKTLKDQKALLFFRVSVITDKRKVLYDSHTKRLLGPRFSQEYVVDHPEVQEAFLKGVGYHEDWSDLLGQKFAYLATAFDFHGKTYILRTAFPYHYVSEIQDEFELAFIAVATLVLLGSLLLSWLILSHFTRPIQRIVRAVRPFQEGKSEILPLIEMGSLNPKDEFSRLAQTLNSLNQLIQEKMDSLKAAGLEKEVLLESLTEGVIAVDAKGVVTFVNHSALEFFGGDKERLIGHTLSETGQAAAGELLKESQEQGKPLSQSLEFRKKGKMIYLNLIAAPKADGTGALLVVQDTTKEVGILEMRKEFIANASHELKTPITIIQGFAEMLHDHPDLPEGSKEELTSKIVRNCQRMETLVRDLLTLADIEHLPDSRLSQFNLKDITEKARLQTLEVYPDAEIAVEGDQIVPFQGDPELMELALFNLVNNAAKYSDPPARVTVKLKQEKENIVVTVEDQGMGIPANDLPHLFERFFRVDKAESRKRGGSGLGLSIVQTVISKHGGTVDVTSKLGAGTKFTVKLPVEAV